MGIFKKLIGLVSLIGLIGLGSQVSHSAEIILRYAGNLPLDHHITKGQEMYANLINERAKGKVKVEVYPAGQLYTDKDYTKVIPSGAVDMATVTTDQWTGLVPGVISLQIPLLYKDREHWWRAMDSEVGETLKKDVEKVGVKILYWQDYGGADLASKFPIRKLEDLKGKRMRGSGETSVKYLKYLGAIPTFLGGGEMYMGLQRGIVEGLNSGVTSFYDRKIYEVCKYLNIGPPHQLSVFMVLINLKKWNELPPDVQKVMMEAGREAQEAGRKIALGKEKECVEKLKEKGMDAYFLPPEETERWRKVAVPPAIEEFLKRTGDDGKKLYSLVEKLR
jgi:tripartite ATP-independent transporter DctP family solute receptor